MKSELAVQNFIEATGPSKRDRALSISWRWMAEVGMCGVVDQKPRVTSVWRDAYSDKTERQGDAVILK
jgi:hypothetical protein